MTRQEQGFMGRHLSRSEYYEWQREKAEMQAAITALVEALRKLRSHIGKPLWENHVDGYVSSGVKNPQELALETWPLVDALLRQYGGSETECKCKWRLHDPFADQIPDAYIDPDCPLHGSGGFLERIAREGETPPPETAYVVSVGQGGDEKVGPTSLSAQSSPPPATPPSEVDDEVSADEAFKTLNDLTRRLAEAEREREAGAALLDIVVNANKELQDDKRAAIARAEAAERYLNENPPPEAEGCYCTPEPAWSPSCNYREHRINFYHDRAEAALEQAKAKAALTSPLRAAVTWLIGSSSKVLPHELQQAVARYDALNAGEETT